MYELPPHPARPSPSTPSAYRRYRYVALATAIVLLFVVAWMAYRSLWGGRTPIDVNLLLSDDDRPHTLVRKINEEGVYESFHTIVLQQKAYTDLNPAYQAAHDLLATSFSRILSPLPVASYHVTLSGVFDQRATKADVTAYNSLVTSHHDRLERVVYAFDHLPDSDSPLTFTLVDVPINGTGITLHVRPKQPRDEQRLAELVALAQETLGPLYKQQVRWHLTLGYKVPPVESVDESQLAEAKSELLRIFEGVDIVVRPPALCVSPHVDTCEDLH